MRFTRRGFILGGASVLFAATLPAHAAPRATLSGRAFGGNWKAVLADGTHAAETAREIGAVLEDIDRAMSPFRPDSAISRFNRAQDTGWQAAGRHFAHVAEEALRIARMSGGAFDPSVGPDVARYGFGPIKGVRTGTFEGFETAAGALRKDDPRLSLDLCGIAKGHALDAVTTHLESAGIRDFLVEIGGEVTARGAAPDGGLWHVGIADPINGGIHVRVSAEELTFATSGDAVNAYRVGPRRYSHTIDPQTGEPVRNDVASVTVATPKGATADGLATALMVMGADRGLDFAEAHGIPALFLVHEAEGVAARANTQFDALRLG